MLDERVSYIVQQMAIGPVTCDEDQGIYECLYCGAQATMETLLDKELEEVKHEPRCAVLLAREVLCEQGTPIKVFKMECEYIYLRDNQGDHWRKSVSMALAISEEVAIRSWQHANNRNVKATFVRVLSE